MAEDVRVTLSTSPDEAVALFKKHHAVDISQKIGWKIRHPRKASFWEFQDDGIVILIMEREGKIDGLSYWNKADFIDKIRRSQTEQSIASLQINAATGKISVEKDQRNRNTNETSK